ncbi:hypothetical protein ACFWA6_09455 [Streptomyces sp. NPDC060020]
MPDDELAVENQAAGALPGHRHQVRPPRSWTSTLADLLSLPIPADRTTP